MSISPNIGGSSIWAESLRPEVEATNEASVAHRLGMPGETLRGQLRDNRSPNFDFVAAVFPSMTDATQDRLLANLTRSTTIRFYRIDSTQSAGEPVVIAIDILKVHCQIVETITSAPRLRQPAAIAAESWPAPLRTAITTLIANLRRDLDFLDASINRATSRRTR